MTDIDGHEISRVSIPNVTIPIKIINSKTTDRIFELIDLRTIARGSIDIVTFEFVAIRKEYNGTKSVLKTRRIVNTGRIYTLIISRSC